MDLGGGPPLKLQQDIELQDLWVPATPAKTTSTRRPLASTHNFGQPSGQSWLDPLVAPSTGVLNALPPWELAFQNGSNGSLLGKCVPDRALAIAEASARRTSDTCFMLNSPSNRCVNMASICWSPELCGNNLAVRNSASMGEMPPFAPSSAQIAGEQEMNNTSTNKCLLNGKVLLEGSSWSVQKGQYKSPATCLNYLNSFQGTNNLTGISMVPNSVTPLIMEKYSKRTQDEQQALVVSNSVQEVGIEENSLNEKVSSSKQVFDSPADASFSNLMALAHQRAFYKNPESAKQIAALTGELTDKLEGHDIPNERGNEVVELSNSSKQKPKRKKHRPKVVIEGKTSRTPKPATPQAKTPKKAQNQESATGKRKYVRRKVAPSVETSRNGLNNNVELESRKAAKSVRRTLNFDLEEAQISEKYCAFMSIQNQVKENPVQGACGDDDALNGLRLVKTVDDRGEQSPVVENSLTRFDPYVDSSPSQAVNEFLKQLQHQPQAPTLMGKPEVGSLQNHDYSFYLNHAVPKGTKRDNCVIVDAFASSNKNLLHPYNTGDCASQSQNAVREGPHHLDVHKRMRTENVEFGAASNTVLTYTSQTGWTTINASNSCQELNFDGAQKLMAPKKIHTVEHLIFGEDAYGNGYTLLSQGNNLTSNGFMNFNRSPGLLEPSSNITSKASALSKPSGYSKRKTVGKRGPRGAKKKGENPPVTPVPPNTTDGAAPGERNTGLTTTASTHLLGGNLHSGFVSLGSKDTGNFKVSTNLCFSSGSLAPCVDDMDDIVQKLKWLSINRDHEVTNSQEQNAIVPYAGNSGEMVLYGGNFDQARRRRTRAKVDLDQETNRVWKLLMGKEGEVDQEVNAHKEKWWEEERRIFQGRVDSFIARMHLVQGDRRFSQWKGSVVDSVIGVFLTQNVSDHLSSSAFMALAAKFPLRSTSNSACSNAEKASSGDPYLASSVAKATENDSKKESSSSNEMVETATGSSGMDNSNGNIKELHEPEVSFGNESPNSCCGIEVSVTRSVSSTDIEDKRFMEEVVSSHNSVTSSQSSTECQAQSSGYIEPNSVLNVEAQNPLIRTRNDGFGSASFTELLQMAEECRFHKLNDQNNEIFLTMQSSSINCQVTHEIGNNPPVLNQPDNSGSTSQHTLYSLPDKLLDSQLCHSLDHANSTTIDNGSMSREEKNGPLLPSNASETSIYIKQEVPFRECNELAEENLAESSILTEVLSDTTTARVIDTYVPIRVQNNPQISSETDIGTGISQHSFDNSSLAERADATSNTESSEVCILAEGMPIIHHKDIHSIIEVESPQYAAQYSNLRENSTNQNPTAALSTKIKNKSDVGVAVINNENFNFQKISYEAPKQGEKGKRRKGEVGKITYDWEGLRKEVYSTKFAKERSSDTVDSLDWEAVRCADVSEIAEVIRERGMNNMLAERIKEFLNRLVREHGNIDLEWLRDVPPDKSKDFLLSIRGLGLKSAECVRLLTLHHLAFPVDTNVGRICVRLGWVPLQPLPESLQLHLLELYPVLETIQKYLWPRLCKLDQRTLYELHYQMITFGKVFCTKSKPNCNSCPMRGECRHFASAFASARLALPAPEDKSIVSSTFPSAYANSLVPEFSPQPIAQLECSSFSKDSTDPKQCEPIVEEPATPEPECQETLESAIEEAFFQDPDEIPTISLNFEKFTQNLQHYIQENMELTDGDMSKALVALTPEAASIPMPKLKNVSRLRTEHQVYEIPDSHPLLKGLEQREPDDPCPYLLAIWTPGETAQSTEPPEASCNSQYTGQLCDRSTCFSCNSVRESQGHIVRGTLLIPCRTAMRGSFPLNGTYFQVNEVFADHISSRNPIDVPRDWIWNLPRRTVYFGTSVPTIFRGLSTEAIQQCFWRGFVCVRGFDRATRAPRPLYARLHFPASKAPKNRKVAAARAAAKVEE